MSSEHVSKDTYFYAHLFTALFHIILAGLLIACYYKNNIFGVKSRHVVMACGVVLLIVSALALIPIIKYKDDEILIN